jgi:microcystin-dependent protein
VSGPGHINGLLVNQSVTAITHNLNTGDYTVPTGKMLYIMDYYGSTSNSAIFIEGLLVYNGYHNHINLGNSRHLAQPVVANAGEVISGSHHFNGYLAPIDYFQSSSGSGNSGSSGSVGGDLPVGMIMPFAGILIPSGWLLCDGSSVSKTTYSDLYSALGDAWGSASSTTFNIPDLRGRFLRGVDSGSGNDPDASSRTAINSGGNTGDNVGSYQDDEFKSHNHGISTSSGSGTSGVMRGGVNNSSSSTSNRGGNETRPKNAYVNYIIKY